MAVTIDNEECIKCCSCVSVCPRMALELKDQIICDEKKCDDCKTCIDFCPVGALSIP